MTGKLIDLTLTIQEGMQTFPTHWHPFVEITQLGRHGLENRETRKLILGTHTGTHMDAPRHFVPNGKTVDEIPLEQLVGPATVVNLSTLPERHELSVSALQQAIDGRPVQRLLLRYDWDRWLGSMHYYNAHPFLSQEAAQWLVTAGCKLVAMDTPMPDNPLHGSRHDPDSPNHKIFLQADVIIVEYLVNLHAISQPVVELIVAPLKIKEGDGSPVRCFVREI